MNAQRLPNEAGFIDLTCAECGLAYSARHPNLDEIDRPICPSCLATPTEGCDADESYPLSRGD